MKTLKTFFIFISIAILFLFIIFVINQTSQVVQLASNLSPDFGRFTLYFLLVVYGLIVFIPIYLFLTLPPSMKLPGSENSDEYDKYIQLLIKRLSKNKFVKKEGIEISSKEDLPKALDYLNNIADKEIKKEATAVFAITALSQSGKLDSFIVLILLTRLVYKIAKIYNQRPRLNELIQLYANVVSTSFIAYSLEEIDIGEQLQPITDNLSEIAAIGTVSSLPGSALISKMLFDGAMNAYLTLRVGIITKQYCSTLVKPERRLLRRSASIQAGKMTILIITETGASIINKLKEKILEKGSSVFENIKEKTNPIFEKGKEKSKSFLEKILGLFSLGE